MTVGAAAPGWTSAWRLLLRPQPLTLPMAALFASIPFYIVIGDVFLAGQPAHVPETAIDRMLPLLPSWTPVYGSLFLAALLPLFVVHERQLVGRTINAFLFLWLTSFAVFLAWPTVSAKPAVAGTDYLSWLLRQVYACDTTRNCFPSLHVAQSYLAAAACSRVHRGVGRWAMVWATLVAASTLFTKQHYAADVAGGMALAATAYAMFLRGYPRDRGRDEERRLAPRLALAACGVYAAMLLFTVALYAAGFEVNGAASAGSR